MCVLQIFPKCNYSIAVYLMPIQMPQNSYTILSLGSNSGQGLAFNVLHITFKQREHFLYHPEFRVFYFVSLAVQTR